MLRGGLAIAALLSMAVACTGGGQESPTPSGGSRAIGPPGSSSPVKSPGNARVTNDARGRYRRSDGGTDATLRACGSSRREQNEPSMAVDPRNPRVVVVGVNDACPEIVNGTSWAGYYRSTDGGRTWDPGLVPGYSADGSSAGLASPAHGRCQDASDPSLSFDRGGRLFYGFVCFSVARTGSGSGAGTLSAFMAVYDHDGARYVRTVLLDQGTRIFAEDKITVTADQTDRPTAGNVYAAWDELAPPTQGGFPRDLLRYSRSTDHGATFTPSRPVSSFAHAVYPDMAVGPDGSLHVAFRIGNSIWMATSTDGGERFAQPKQVEQFVEFDSVHFAVSHGFDCGDGPFHCPVPYTFFRFSSAPAVAADADGVHVAWSAQRAGQGKIFVRNSPDGHSWRGPSRPVDAVSTGHQWFPDMVSADGVLAVAFYDSRRDPAYAAFVPPGNTREGKSSGGAVDVVVARSPDGGRTWTETRATDRSFNPNLEIEGWGRVPFLGDYISVSAGGDSLVTAWTDLRDVVRGKDQREDGGSDDDDGFDVYLPCGWIPDDIGAASFDRPFLDNPCLSKGGMDANVYFARLG